MEFLRNPTTTTTSTTNSASASIRPFTYAPTPNNPSAPDGSKLTHFCLAAPATRVSSFSPSQQSASDLE